MRGILGLVSRLPKVLLTVQTGPKHPLSIHRCLHCGRPMKVYTGEDAVTTSQRIAELKERGLLQIAGNDAAGLLQGLITNNMEILNSGQRMRAMYTMFLNSQGRVLYDVLIYHRNHLDRPTYLIECDSAVLPDLHKHIKMHRLRKKADLCDVSSEYTVWSLFGQKQFTLSDDVWIPDPRLSTFMYRAVTPADMSVSDMAGSAVPVSADDYRRYRYELGLVEGILDLPPGEPLPLEANLGFLNGVDFNKGCYLGQELTARTHHTGVIRKRIMPVRLESSTEQIPVGSAIKTEKGRNAGKFRGQIGTSGIALLRVAHGGEPLHAVLPNGTRCEMAAHVPPWWPKDCIDHCQKRD